MNLMVNISNKLIIFLGGYTRKEIKYMYFIGIRNGHLAKKPIDFESDYYNPEKIIKIYDKTRSNRNC